MWITLHVYWKHYKLLFFDNEKESEKNNKTPFGSSISNLFDHLLIIFTGTTVFLFVNCQYISLQGFWSICT
jgi:hypothetical protein